MLLALVQFIPLSLAAITPTMVIFVTALLAQDGHIKRALAVALGRYCGLLLLGFAALFILNQVPRAPAKNTLDQHEAIPTIFLIVGLILMLAAGYTVLFGQVPSEENQHSLLERMRTLSWPLLFGACLVTAFVSIRQISLLFAGVAIIKETSTDEASELILLVALCLFMIWPMLVPLGIKLAMGERGDALLERLRDWMDVHQRGINGVVLAFFGGILVAKGISGLV